MIIFLFKSYGWNLGKCYPIAWICKENFSRTELKKHKATIHGIGNISPEKPIKPFKCPFCTHAFKSKKGLQRHSELKHNTEIEVEMGSDVEIENEVQFIQYT